MNVRNGLNAACVSRRAFLGAACLCLCAAPTGCAMLHRPKPIDAAVYTTAVSKTTSQALKEIKRQGSIEAVLDKDKEKDKDGANGETKSESKEKPVVCFIGVLGNSAEEISNAARAELDDSAEIKLIGKAKFQAALKECGIRASEVYIPAQRKLFVEQLGESFDYLMAGYVETIEEPIDPNDENSKTYDKTIFRLELVNMETNRKSEFTADL